MIFASFDSEISLVVGTGSTADLNRKGNLGLCVGLSIFLQTHPSHCLYIPTRVLVESVNTFTD